MNNILNKYLTTFKGLSREIWWLSFVTLINRAGTMVIPFLTLYLTRDLEFTIGDVGWVMSAFGAGSMIGSWCGGKLTDKIGFYKLMVFSLLGSGFLFIGLQFLDTFFSFCLGIFILMIVADLFRPAMYVAIDAYSKPENKTRSITLIRLAINLGFSAGPALGGVIITYLSYGGLFWVDGITCIFAGLLLIRFLAPKKSQHQVPQFNPVIKSSVKDSLYLVFLGALVLFFIAFIQYFSTVPLYYKEVYLLDEFQIGLLLGLNGILIFLFEMPLIHYLEKKAMPVLSIILLGSVLLTMSYFILTLNLWPAVLIVGILFMTVGEMIVLPFSNSFALKRSQDHNRGQYMGLYSLAFSIAHIVGHNSGMQLVKEFGFQVTWYVIISLMILCSLMFLFIENKIRISESNKLKVQSIGVCDSAPQREGGANSGSKYQDQKR